jgi:hypothetical protein
LALYKGGAFLHPEQGDEKERKVMIDSLEPTLIKAAGAAHSWLTVQGDGFRLDSRNKEKHGSTHAGVRINQRYVATRP